MKMFVTFALFVLLILPLATKDKIRKRMYVSVQDVEIRGTPELESEALGTLELGDYPYVFSYNDSNLVKSFGDKYCITAFENANDICGRSEVGYSIYKSLR